MPDKGIVRGTHHLTFCVAGAQEDYDFHTGLLGLYCVKKTVLFDGELPIYHLYYANRVGDGSTVLTSFPYGQQGIYGKRGTNQLKSINIAVPADSIGYWADRLATGGVEYAESELFGALRLHFAHPCGIPYVIVGESEKDDREPWDGGDVPGDHAIRGAHGTTTSLRDPAPMGSFLTDAMNGELVSSEGPNHQYRIGTDEGYGRMIELVEEPDLPQGTWQFGAGTIHHHAFDVVEPANQAVVKDWIVGLGFTDASDVKDRGYFFSVYLRTPGGALFELAQSAGRGFLVDETYEELGTNMCIPPHWEHRRSEIATLEPIVTREPVA